MIRRLRIPGYSYACLALVGLIACGEVQLATVATPDSGATGAPPGVSDKTDGAQPSVLCGAPSGAEPVLDLKANGYEIATDFYGDGTGVVVGLNVIADFQNGRVARIQGTKLSELVNVSPSSIRRIAPGKGRVFMSVDVSPGAEISWAPTAGGQRETVALGALGAFAAHTGRSEVFFRTTTPAPPLQEVVQRWDPPAKPENAIVLSQSLRLMTLSASASGLVALVADTTALVPRWEVVRAPKLAGGGPFTSIASISGASVSNVSNAVLDGNEVYVAAQGAPSPTSPDRVAIYRVAYDAEGVSLGGVVVGAERIATVPALETDGVRIEVDDTHVYVVVGEDTPPCRGGTLCEADLSVYRVQKQGTPLTNAPSKVKSFRGAATSEEHYRAFNVDACFVYWYDTNAKTLWRQSKTSL